MKKTRKLPIGIQSFEDIIKNGYIYVDKTKFIWNLVETGKVYFLSLPRRFGKSLLISTMEAYFLGKKDLFRGLAIEKLESSRGDDAWTEYPVIKFSLSGGEYNSEDGLRDRLRGEMESCIKRYELKENFEIIGETLPVRFQNLIEQLYLKTGRQVVILVDEYDKPLLETMIINGEQEEKNRLLYKGFFSVLKDADQYLKFVFFTGVTKFSKVSIFSDLNQLEDISLTERYAEICGITEAELLNSFEPEIEAITAKMKITKEECIKKLADMYDGYHFAPEGKGMYNPFSLLSALKQRKFDSYWFDTGTPTFLVNKLRTSGMTLENLNDGVEASEMAIKSYRPESKDPVPLLYQSGYLTISGFDEEFMIYSLEFPNNEVKYGFINFLVPYVIGEDESEGPVTARSMVKALRNGDVDGFLTHMQSLFAGISYPEGAVPNYEREWRNQIYLILKLMGQNVKCEVHTATGRADCIIETKNYIYILEFKMDKSAAEALAQINEKGYADPYKADSRSIYKIGVNFSSEKRNVENWEYNIN